MLRWYLEKDLKAHELLPWNRYHVLMLFLGNSEILPSTHFGNANKPPRNP